MDDADSCDDRVNLVQKTSSQMSAPLKTNMNSSGPLKTYTSSFQLKGPVTKRPGIPIDRPPDRVKMLADAIKEYSIEKKIELNLKPNLNVKPGEFPGIPISKLQLGLSKIFQGEGMRISLSPDGIIIIRSNDERLAEVTKSNLKSVAYGSKEKGQDDWLAIKPKHRLDSFKQELDPDSEQELKRRIVVIAKPDDIVYFIKCLRNHKIQAAPKVFVELKNLYDDEHNFLISNSLVDRTQTCLGVVNAKVANLQEVPYVYIRKRRMSSPTSPVSERPFKFTRPNAKMDDKVHDLSTPTRSKDMSFMNSSIREKSPMNTRFRDWRSTKTMANNKSLSPTEISYREKSPYSSTRTRSRNKSFDSLSETRFREETTDFPTVDTNVRTYKRKSIMRNSNTNSAISSMCRVRSPRKQNRSLVYGGVSLTEEDFKRLEDGEFYNDSIVELYLKLIINNIRLCNPSLADSIHLFTPFFYERLTQRGKSGISYQHVKKWTAKVDIFAKEFLIIPINENFHWYVAVVAFPKRILQWANEPILVSSNDIKSGRSRDVDTTSLEMNTGELEMNTDVMKDNNKSMRNGCIEINDNLTPSRKISKRQSLANSARGVDLEMLRNKREKQYSMGRFKGFKVDIEDSDEDSNIEMSEIEDVIVVDSQSSKHKKRNISIVSEYLDAIQDQNSVDVQMENVRRSFSHSPSPVPQQPRPRSLKNGRRESIQNNPFAKPREATYVIIMDSLGGRPRKVFTSVHEYLYQEAKEKRNVLLPNPKYWAEKKLVRDLYARVPEQVNHVDCGPYLLHNIETFFNAKTEDKNDINMDVVDMPIMDPGTFAEVIGAKEDRGRWMEVAVTMQRERVRNVLNTLAIEEKSKQKEKKDEDESNNGNDIVRRTREPSEDIDAIAELDVI